MPSILDMVSKKYWIRYQKSIWNGIGDISDDVYDIRYLRVLVLRKQVHLNKSEWHGDNTEAEIGDSQVGDKHIPDNFFLVRLIDERIETEILAF